MFRYQPLLFQPVPSLVGYPLSEIVEETRAVHFPDIEDYIEVRFAAEAPLAYIARGFMGRERHLVVFHPVLNHPNTPSEVLRFLAKHELTHIVRPPRLIDGYGETHPPEFWEHEAEIGPERYAVWAWIYKNLGRCLRRGDQGIRVTGEWRAIRETSRTPYMPSLPFNGERWERICPGGGAQLHLPPDWVRRPMPLHDTGACGSAQRRPRRWWDATSASRYNSGS
jgi:hypothetical protein